MYKIGDLLVYGVNGVCIVRNICHSPFNKNDEREYYILKPLFGPDSSTIYTPVENRNIIMRDLLSEEEITALIKKIPEIPPITVEIEKQRKEVYRMAILTADLEEYVKIIKAVDARRCIFEKTRKHLPNTDTDYESLAKRRLYEEIAAVLDMNPNEVSAYIRSCIEQTDAE